MKTAMQQLIDVIDNEVYNHTEEYTTRELNVYARIKNECLTLLEEEKRQIVEAWNDGFYGLESPETQSAEQYYNQTYNNENKQDTIQ